MNALETKNLTKQFDGVRAVADLSIAIERGKLTSIIGPNGSGKTTLINVLTGLHAISHGMVVVSEVKLSQIEPYDVMSYGITRTFQDVRVFEQMHVLDNILVTLTERDVFSALAERHTKLHEERAEAVLRRVGLWEKRHELAKNLSYGQRKLLEIARGLAMNVEIIFLDEPFAGLFPEMVKTVVGIMKELREQGRTLILVEHNMDLIRELSDHVIVMDSGQLLAQGKPAEVLARRDVVEAYLGE
ncbi:MAG: hypothetical protein A2542_00720 [Parcubacteria group bacterium RIFOXYD2_FULL_52_8]|nr:MAG: hypothetical protein A2542_00720 [Parcubacteria group bacterium RIFOXYD2_FULL_52_8]